MCHPHPLCSAWMVGAKYLAFVAKYLFYVSKKFPICKSATVNRVRESVWLGGRQTRMKNIFQQNQIGQINGQSHEAIDKYRDFAIYSEESFADEFCYFCQFL